ncbi:lipocalin family protein [Pedobacter jamesrossensis]|uniref:Lipocalin family protein n=1 Tax=Pedobacter jamesrossensis TaxID=1908238 RepID=A0ABV8NNP0_9SPHI
MKINALIIFAGLSLSACNNSQNKSDESLKITGTWQLKSSLAITNGDTVNTTPAKNTEMIKIFNETHFAFFSHDLNQGKDSSAVYSSGSGTYSLIGNNYKEHLEYCSARGWENHDFDFKLSIKKDTLEQKGIEKIDSLNINREIIEIYVRNKK